MLTDEEFKAGIKPCDESHVPNAETIEAIEAARRGEVAPFNSVEELFSELDSADNPEFAG